MRWDEEELAGQAELDRLTAPDESQVTPTGPLTHAEVEDALGITEVTAEVITDDDYDSEDPFEQAFELLEEVSGLLFLIMGEAVYKAIPLDNWLTLCQFDRKLSAFLKDYEDKE